MASKFDDRALLALLRVYGSSPNCLRTQRAKRSWHHAAGPAAASDRSQRHIRHYGTRTSNNIEVAVLGGGLTGLTTAYYLSRFHRGANITIYESSKRLGGWIDTEKFRLKHDSKEDAFDVNLERGARAIAVNNKAAKWDELVFYELLLHLKLGDAVTGMKGSTLLDNRYLYYPDHLARAGPPPFSSQDRLGSAVRLLQYFGSLFTEPLYTGAFSSLMSEARFKPDVELPFGRGRGFPEDDVSIGDFFAEAFGRRDLVDNALSGMVHGIYGGDVYKLSMASSIFSRYWLRKCWNLAQDNRNPSQFTPMFPSDLHFFRDIGENEPSAMQVARNIGSNKALFVMKDGMETLTKALEAKLRENPRVTVKLNAAVSKIENDPAYGKVRIETADNKPSKVYDKVISSLLSKTLYNLTDKALPSLRNEDAVTIQVVNLLYPKPRLNHPRAGFGYLIPSSVDFETQNPEAALGVIFDSDIDAAAAMAAPGFDPATSPDPWQNTKLTVMLGGHHWDFLGPEDWPAADDAAAMARAVVERHLGIPRDEAVAAAVKLCRDCIPQHRVGHMGRMARAHHELAAAFGGRLAVVGGSYTAQGVLPALRAARDMAMRVAGRDHGVNVGAGADHLRVAPGMGHIGDTGLARFAHPERDLVFAAPKNHVPLRFGNTQTPWDEQ